MSSFCASVRLTANGAVRGDRASATLLAVSSIHKARSLATSSNIVVLGTRTSVDHAAADRDAPLVRGAASGVNEAHRLRDVAGGAQLAAERANGVEVVRLPCPQVVAVHVVAAELRMGFEERHGVAHALQMPLLLGGHHLLDALTSTGGAAVVEVALAPHPALGVVGHRPHRFESQQQ